MKKNKRTARIVGILFILATVAGAISALLLTSTLGAPNFLTKIYENQNQMIIGALMILIMGICVAGVAIWMYPIFKKHYPGMALGYAGARIVECVVDIVLVIIILSLVTLSKQFIVAGSPDNSHFQVTSQLLLKLQEQWVGPFLLAIVFCISGLMLYYMLYRTKLVPRFLSIWGLCAIVLHLVATFLPLFGVDPTSSIFIVLDVPIAINEMVLAVWLIIKGFNAPANEPELSIAA